jgi:hypothetical protein
VKLWDLGVAGHTLVHDFKGAHPLGAHHVTASTAARLAATAGFGGEIHLWNLEEKSHQAKIESIAPATCSLTFANSYFPHRR